MRTRWTMGRSLQALLRGRRGLALVATLLILALALAGCGGAGSAPGGSGGSPAGSSGQAPAGEAGAAAHTAYPYTFTDDAGRQVTLEARPERIISLAPSNTEILFAIGAGDRVVGVDSFSDFPAEVKDLPKLGGLTDTNYEQIVALKPDLALTIGGTEDQVKKLEELGIPVAVIQPKTVDEVLDRIQRIGELVDAQDGAARVVEDMRARIDAVRQRVAGIPAEQRVRVFYEVWNDPLMTVGPGGFIHDVIVTAGGINVAEGTGQAWPQISLEEVVRQDPQVIVVPASLETSYKELKEKRRQGWEGITAVKEGRIYVIDDNLISRPGPRLVEGLEQLARWFYPDRFQ
ncbi:periplasmic binding protein [Thermaerobacter marianensis DSM 12885]|uniref:Periplasmic binding protein n=1 Tax=Thermaerobacter marianensis (strain ATCC 700841 / DSM 12885 / JCM 10246 / 7p75a) TaxID=644966 RepID=E6SLW6_THEM7|nr:cobalamin-binding protein [Thermaerobacter marianensis]ADU51415.1 periplasmic binding protein [Thermaerobacter marianensis DSM 12885]